ncbi:transcription factor mef2A [Anopheles aquasalis]|uniref:transcription factor mef2A n=1 Tax=Anopheles aquasalis TaxID=42839 RepID=UPI00215AEEB8|nr:transcription factor mef2A [Anopheles aquasalis]
MICKEDVVNWFRDLKSYNRIDTMCVLLNMCLPFELRFLGTYLEELGRRDGPELRGAELKVNNPQEFIADIASGEPTDRRIRRKMALFLALFRTCNHTYANELFKTLEGWGARGDLQRLFEEDVLQELLLVYTMATNHPVFSFEQRLHCGEIFTKLKSCETKTGSQQQRLQDREDTVEHQHPQHHQQHHTTQQHHQHHQHQSQHQSLDSLQSNSPQQSPIQQQQQQQQQQQHHQQQSQHQPPHLQNSTPPPVSSQLSSQMASAPDTTSLHQALPPNAPMSLQIVPQSGVPTTIALSYTGQPALTQVVGTGMDGSITTHYIETLPQLAQLPLQPDFTIPPPGPNTTARWATFPVYHPMYPPPASSPHMSNPSSPIQSRTTSPTRIHPSSVQHRISRNQQNDQQQQQQQQNQAQVQNLKNVDEDQTTLMMSQMQLRNGMRQPHNTLPRQSKQGYVNQLPSYHHQQQQQQHHSQRGDSSSSGSYHTLNYGMKGAGMMMDMMNHQSKSTGSDSGSSIGSDVSPPETPGVVPVSGGGGSGGGGGGGGGGVPHVRSSNRANMRTINGRLEKPTYSQLQQQQQFAGSEGLMVVTSGGQNFLTTGTTNGAAMSSNGNNGASGSGVVSGPLLINPAAAAGTAPPNPGSTGAGTSLLLTTPAYATGPYAGSATAYQVGTGAPHLVPHRQIAGATLTHAGTPYRPAAYPPTMQPSTADGLMYPYHTTTVLPPSAAGTPGSVGQASSLPFLPPPTGPGGTTVGSVAVASTQTSLPNLRSSPSQQSTTAGIASSPIGLLQTGKAMTISGYGTGLPLVSSTFGVGGGSCYNCGSQKHTGLDCPEASMEDMTRNSNFTLDYNTTSSSGPSSVTLTTSTSTLASNNNSSAAEHHSAGVIKLDRDNSSSSSSTGSSSNNSTSSSGVGTGSTQMTSNSTASSNSNSSSSNNNNNNGSNSSNNSNNSSLDVPSSSPTSSSIAVALDSGNSGVPGTTGSSSTSSNTTSSSSNSSGNASSSNSSNLVNVSGK